MKFLVSTHSMDFKDPIDPGNSTRKIILIQLRNEKRFFCGECSPYPFPDQQESQLVQQIKEGVEVLLQHWNRKNISFNELLVLLNEESKARCWDHSSLYSIEALATQLLFDRDKQISAFSFTEKNQITLNAFLSGSAGQIKAQAFSHKKEGYSCFKIKIDSNDKENFLKVKNLRENVQAACSIRLDFNRKLGLEDAIRFTQKVKKFRIDHIEEPVSDVNDIYIFFKNTKIRYALDESLMEAPSFIKEGAHIWILKPMRLGLLNSLLLREEASQKNINVIFTSNFETALGMATTLPFIKDRSTPMGFDTLKFFADPLLRRSLKRKKASLCFSFSEYLNELGHLKIFKTNTF